jgi:hypothetical protein
VITAAILDEMTPQEHRAAPLGAYRMCCSMTQAPSLVLAAPVASELGEFGGIGVGRCGCGS